MCNSTRCPEVKELEHIYDASWFVRSPSHQTFGSFSLLQTQYTHPLLKVQSQCHPGTASSSGAGSQGGVMGSPYQHEVQ